MGSSCFILSTSFAQNSIVQIFYIGFICKIKMFNLQQIKEIILPLKAIIEI